MTTMPDRDLLSNPASITASTATAWCGELAKLYDVVNETLGNQSGGELTIAAGAVTATAGYHSIDTEADAAADNLDNISAADMPDGRFLMIKAQNAGRIPTVKHQAGGAGQITLADGNDFTLSGSRRLLLERSGTDWVEVARFYGNDAAAMRAFLGVYGTGEVVPRTGGITMLGGVDPMIVANVNVAADDTITPNSLTGPMQTFTINGNCTLAAPASDNGVILDLVLDGSGYEVDVSAYTNPDTVDTSKTGTVRIAVLRQNGLNTLTVIAEPA